MEALIRNRLSDRRFYDSRPVEVVQARTWVTLAERPNLSIHRVNASAENKASEDNQENESKPKKKKRRAGSKKGSVTSDGTDNGSCWSNYRRKKNTKKYAKGSCEPKDGD